MKKIIFSAIILTNLVAVKAQETTQDIDEVLIHGKFLNTPYKKINENIEVITKKDLEISPAKSIDEVLQQYTGLDVRRRGANGVQSDISVRGGSSEQVLILLNGIRMNDSQTGHNSMNIPVDLSNVERIEVIKGPAASRFGNGAYAVINIITKASSQNEVKISAEGGDFSTYSLGLASHFGTEKFSNLFQVNTSGSEGYRYNTDYEIQNVFYQNQYQIKNGTIGLQAGFSEKKFGANGFYASAAAKDQYEETQASVVALRHQQNFGKFSLNSNIYWRRGQDMYLYIRNKPEVYRNMHIGNNVGGEVNGSYKSNLGVTGLGVELRKEFLVSSNLGNRNRFLTQMFFEHQFSLIGSKLQISPAVSWANYSNEGNFFYPGISVGYDFNEQNKIYGNVSKVHRIPTYTDLFYKSKTEQGNPNLVPEHAVSSEIGYRFQNRNILAKVSGFMRNSDNSIDWLKSADNAVWIAENVGKINMRGIETEFKHQFNSWLNYSLGYTYLDSDYSVKNAAFSRYTLDHMKHQLVATLNTKFLKYFTNELIYRYNERKSLGSYNLLDEKLSYDNGNFNIYLLINNLTNTKFSETFSVSMPGRWFHIGANYKIGL